MSKPNSEKTWGDLTPQQTDHFYKLIAGRANSLGEGAHDGRLELAKYLFGANAGAAAGLFSLLQASPDSRAYLAAFFLFCIGTFFVGFSHLLCADWLHDMARGWQTDFDSLGREEITLGQLDERYRRRSHSLKFKFTRIGLWISFFCLIAGGITAAKPFWARPASKPAATVRP